MIAKKTDLYLRLVLLFFFFMLVTPTAFQVERGAMLALILLGAFYNYILIKRVYMHPQVFVLGLITVSYSIIGILIGVWLRAPGATAVSTVYVLWPVLYLFLIGTVQSLNFVKTLFSVVLYATIVSAVMGIFLVLDASLGLGLGLTLLLESFGSITGFYDGLVEYRLHNITTVVYAIPFAFSLLVMDSRWYGTIRKRKLTWLAFLICIPTIFLSGRRGLMLVGFLTPIIVYSLAKLSNVRVQTYKFSMWPIIAAAAVIPILPLVIDINYDEIWRNFIASFDLTGGSDLSGSTRGAQFSVLLNEWLERPLFGHGHGAVVSGHVRNAEQPWTFELSYNALLFQVGLLGTLVYLVGILWIFATGIKIMRRSPQFAAYLLPLLSGLACFLIVNATNPYLQKFDYLWTVFLPICVINNLLLRKY